MLRISAILLVSTVPLLFAGEARSQGGSHGHSAAAKMSAQSGQCPTGTCAKDGTSFARYLKFCSAANCLNNRFNKKQTQR